MSEPRTPVTGEPVDVHEQKAKAEQAIKEKVVKTVDELGKIVRKTIGPPGTP